MDMDKIVADAVKEVDEKIASGAETPKLEEKPEPKIEEKETLKTEEKKVEDNTITPEPPKSIKETVPIGVLIREQKEVQKLKNKIKELESQKTTTPETKQETNPDWEEQFYQLAIKNNWTQEQYEQEREKALLYTQPFKSKLENLEQAKKELEEIKEKEDVDRFYNEVADTLDETIRKEHKDITDVQVADIKNKVIQLGKDKGITDLALIYRGTPDFRPIKREKSAEPSRPTGTGTQKVIDFSNLSLEDFERLSDNDKLSYSKWLEQKEKAD